MMVNHYFGSKERLFAEVVENAYARKGILTSWPAQSEMGNAAVA